MVAAAKRTWRIEPLGDRCLIVAFGDEIDLETNLRARAVAEHLLAHPVPGVVDVVPAFTTVALHYRPEAFTDAGAGVPFEQLAARIQQVLLAGVGRRRPTARRIEIPVCYGGDFGPDLAELARARELTTEEVIAIHARSPHVVHMLGFAPGHPYIAGLDKRLAMPRRATPRLKIPPGSVGVTGTQSTIYPLETPGGWNLIGRTPLRLFTPEKDPPCLLRPGDEVRFVPIPAKEFATLHERAWRRTP
ncbi:MAG: 5-oxoprolinase subunit PxpB [Burkholderiales bacterium]|nr:5-oxoprolinase subunit PxpB [Burkholderiales bacterium]